MLMIPLITWALTGFIFFIKPGYAGAYDYLVPKTYPLEGGLSITPPAGWLEFRLLKTVLGYHLMARTDSGWLHIDPATMQARGEPTEAEITNLVMDASAANRERYGQVARVANDTIWTDTGVEIILDWKHLSFQQRGKDTDRIDMLYKIHYLQWTGIPGIDKVLGMSGIILLLILAALGLKLAFRSA